MIPNLLDDLKLEAAEFLWNLPRSMPVDERWNNIGQKLLTDGCCVIEDFLDAGTVDQLVDEADRIHAEHAQYVSLESNGSDRRIYGVDRISDDFRLDDHMRAIDALSRAFYWSERVEWFQLLGRISYSPQNLGSGSGWHRDSPFSHQFKALLYLSDVDESNGPFEYLMGSHRKNSVKAVAACLRTRPHQYRFSSEQIERLENAGVVPRRASVIARKGALLLVDSRGLHRGKPLQAGERLAVTRYYFSRKVPAHVTNQYPLTGQQANRE
jgi:hypothetical protein